MDVGGPGVPHIALHRHLEAAPHVGERIETGGNRIMSLRSVAKDLISPHPWLFLPLYRLFGKPHIKAMLIADRTDIVIEGFPRSANTFAALAFLSSQKTARSLAHHLHSEAQILEGVRRGVPCVALIREPEEAIRALKFAFPAYDENCALKRWIRFYEGISRVRDRVVIADFNTVTKDFGSVIADVNGKFGTAFDIFDGEEGGSEQVLGLISDLDRKTGGSLGAAGAKPSEEKARQKKKIALHFDAKALAKAQRIFADLTNRAVLPREA